MPDSPELADDLEEVDVADLRAGAEVDDSHLAAELAKAVVADVRLERTTIVDTQGIGGLRDIVLSADMVVPFALAFLDSFGITVDDG